MKAILGLLGLAALSGLSALAADPTPAEIDTIFSDLDSTRSPGCALGVIRDGDFLYRRGYGMASLEHAMPIDSDTVFYVGSVSKQFVAGSVLLAAEEGFLSLDDDIRNHISELPDYGATITVRHLIHHTSGLRDYLGLLRLAGRPAADVISDEEIVDLIVRQKALNFPPGSQYRYSNSGYFLLAEIVKRTTGETLRTFAERRIFEPLHMRDSRFHDDRRQIVPRRALAYTPASPDGFELDWSSNFDKVGSGGLLSTIDDFLAWDRNFEDPRVGSAQFLAQLLAPGKLLDGTPQDYAFGLRIASRRGMATISHGGSMFGYRSAYLRFPQQRFSVVAFCNLSSADPMQRVERVADLYLEGLYPEKAGKDRSRTEADKPPKPYKIEPTVVSELAGRYYSSELDAVYEFEAVAGTLILKASKTWERTALLPIGERSFIVDGKTFAFDSDGLTLDAGRVVGIRFRGK